MMAHSLAKIGFGTFFLGILLFGTMTHAAEIRLKNVPVRCSESLVTLAEIADVLPMGGGMGGEDIESLRKIVLFPAPADGETRTLDQWELRTILSRLGVSSLHHSIAGAEKITISGTIAKIVDPVGPHEQFVIQTNYTEVVNFASLDSANPTTAGTVGGRSLSPAPARGYLTPTGTNPVTPIAVRSDVSPKTAGITDELSRLLEKQIAQALNVYLNFTNKIERTWDISLKLTPEQVKLLATGGQIAEITGGQIPFIGIQQFHIRMQNSVTVTVDVTVELPTEVVVVRRALSKGYIITESDVMLQRANRMQGDDFFVDTKSVVGKETVRAVRELSPLTQSAVRQPLWVRKGEIVTVRATSGGITVRTEATALQDGTDGDTITISKIDLSPKRGKKEEPVTYLARVCAPKTVEVFVNSN